MTQGKIERYHRSLKNVVKLEHYYTPWDVERAVAHFVEDYNHRRYHEALQNVTPADMFHARQVTILARRARIKQRTLQQRKRENIQRPHHAAFARMCLYATAPKCPTWSDDVPGAALQSHQSQVGRDRRAG